MRFIYDYLFEKPTLAEYRAELTKSPLFAKFASREIDKVLKFTTLRHFSAKEHVFFEGDLSSALYLILRGAIDIIKQAPKKRLILAHLSKGMFFGEIGIVHISSRSASAVAASDSLLLCLFKHDVDNIIKHYPRTGSKLLANIAEILAQRLIATNKKLGEFEKG